MIDKCDTLIIGAKFAHKSGTIHMHRHIALTADIFAFVKQSGPMHSQLFKFANVNVQVCNMEKLGMGTSLPSVKCFAIWNCEISHPVVVGHM
jgi:hypothetical protein